MEYVEGYTSKIVQADALWFGVGIHEALALWYGKGKRRGPHPADTFAKWAGDEIAEVKTYLDDTYDAPVWEDARDLGIMMLEEYVDFYGKDPYWSIIATEQPFRIAIIRNGQTVAYFRGIWDGVLRDLRTGKIYLLENKTASQINTAYLDMDEQGGSYFAVATAILRAKGILKQNEVIAGIIYNFLRKARPDERPVNEAGLRLNKDGTESKKQPPALFVRELVTRSQPEVRTQLERIADEVEWMEAVRSGALPVTKTNTKDCPRCPFYQPCRLHERGAESYKSILRAHYRKNVEPDNRKSAA
jgi:hypothetical protein